MRAQLNTGKKRGVGCQPIVRRDRYQRMHALNVIDTTERSEDIHALKAIITERDAQIASQAERIAQLGAQLESLHQQILNLRRMHFGASSERFAGQAELFGQTASVPMPPQTSQTITYERKASRGRPALPKDLPRQRIDYDLSAEEKGEFDALQKIGEEISETLDYTPAKLIVIEHARAKYRCEKDGAATVRTAWAEPSPLPKSNASAGLIAHVLVSKYQDHLPLNRQERKFARDGVTLAKATLCDWTMGAGDLLGRLMAPLKAHVLADAVIGADDTPLPVAERGRGKTRTARLWVYRGGGFKREDEDDSDGSQSRGIWKPHPVGVIFEFTDSREGAHPMRFLRGYSGYLQADAYPGFDALYRDGRIVEVACWAHVRRKFFEVAKSHQQPGLAHQALDFIRALYALEAEIKDQPPDDKRDARQARSTPVLADFKLWLDGHAPTLLPKSPLGNAFGYALSNWRALTRYTENGILAPDNNAVERAIRPIAVGRHNWLFAGSARGGHTAAVILSLIETAKIHGVEPFAYLRDVLARIGSHRIDRLAELLPFNWKPAAP